MDLCVPSGKRSINRELQNTRPVLAQRPKAKKVLNIAVILFHTTVVEMYTYDSCKFQIAILNTSWLKLINSRKFHVF